MICLNMKKILTLALVGTLTASLAHGEICKNVKNTSDWECYPSPDEKEDREGGFYISGSIGTTDDTDAGFSTPGTAGTAVLPSETLLGDVAFGYAFKKGLRIEGEIAWIPLELTDLNYLRFDGAPIDFINQNAAIGGDVSAQSFSLNLLYDFELGEWRPYIGVGLGVTNLDVTIKGDVAGETVFYDDDDNVFTVNSVLGVKRALTESGATSLDIGLTYSKLNDSHFITNGNRLNGHDVDIVSIRAGIEHRIGKKKRHHNQQRRRK
ncbi:MAG: outer membrane beta-barrel protein [Bacteriovoracales bacterium]|nr:outer membrane beta-barrel protein [Bacteriovoracales bacterium]